MTKHCIICGTEFVPRNCKHLCCSKSCSEIYRKKYYKLNKEKIIFKVNEYQKRNIDKIIQYRKKYREINKKYYIKICPICNKNFTTTKSKKICCNDECNKIRKRKKAQKYLNSKYKNNINFKLSVLARTNIKRCLDIIKNNSKEYPTFDILGYTPKQLKDRLEFQFKNGMTWENYGTYWEIHHKKEVSKFNFGDKNNINYKQIKLAHSLANLQPLTIEEHKNIHKTLNIDFKPTHTLCIKSLYIR